MRRDISNCALQKNVFHRLTQVGYQTNKATTTSKGGESESRVSTMLFKMFTIKLKIIRHEKKK